MTEEQATVTNGPSDAELSGQNAKAQFGIMNPDFVGLTSDELDAYVAESEQRPGESATDHAARALRLRNEIEALAARRREERGQ